MLQRRDLPVEEPRGNQQDAYSAAQRDARSQKEGPLVARGGGGSRVPARRREERRQVRSLRHGHARRVGCSRESRGRPPSRQRFGCRRVLYFFCFGFWRTPTFPEISPPPNTQYNSTTTRAHQCFWASLWGVLPDWVGQEVENGGRGVASLTRGLSHWTWGTQEGTVA